MKTMATMAKIRDEAAKRDRLLRFLMAPDHPPSSKKWGFSASDLNVYTGVPLRQIRLLLDRHPRVRVYDFRGARFYRYV